MRRSSVSSRCVHEHHCGSQGSVSVNPSRGAPSLGMGSMELPPFREDVQSSLTPLGSLNSIQRKKSWPIMKQVSLDGSAGMVDRGLGRQDRVMEEEEEEEEEGRCDVYVCRGGSLRGNYEMAQRRSMSMDF